VMAACAAFWALLIFLPGMPLYGDGQRSLPNGRVLLEQGFIAQTPGSEVPAGATVLAKEPVQVLSKGAPHVVEGPGPRWSHVVVPMIVISFLIPGLVFGWLTGKLKSQADVAEALNHGIRGIVPIMVYVGVRWRQYLV
jgi:hypothetical protein